ncbi:MAG: polyphosphate polymerase domain-containing protein [Lachnospiraceae bacterium]|nr:polyphosphate polymerase domain-containing protein [Lachnospiraceae bacterium]
MGDQTIFKRYEVKYILTRQQQRRVLEAMAPYMIMDEHGRSQIQSLYYDTPNSILARRSLDKPMYKEKLRLRSYGIASDDSQVFVEIKKKYDGIVYKRRVSMLLPQSRAFLPESFSGTPEAKRFLLKSFRERLKAGSSKEQIVKEIEYFVQYYKGIRPAMMLQYERDAFYAADDHEFRITFDDNIRWRTDDLRLDKGYYGNRLLDKNYVLMEVKVGAAMPAWFVKILTDNRIYKTSFSKYGTAYLLDNGLAGNLPEPTKQVLFEKNLYEFKACI